MATLPEDLVQESPSNSVPYTVSLQKLDTRLKKQRLWEMTAFSDGKVVTEWGVENGAFQKEEYTILKGKVKRTIFQQACLEVTSTARKKMRSGYIVQPGKFAPVPSNGTVVGALKPMCLLEWADHGHKWPFDVVRYAQPKLDGNRGLFMRDGFFVSRGAKLFPNPLPHLVDHCKKLFKKLPLWIRALDGELYTHGMRYEEINGVVHRADCDSSKISYWIYDVIPNEENMTLSYEHRLKALEAAFDKESLIEGSKAQFGPLFLVSSIIVEPGNEVYLHNRFVEDKFEGMVVRRSDGVYRFGPTKTQHVLKYKVFHQTEHVVVGVEEKKGEPGTLGSFRLRSLPSILPDHAGDIENGFLFDAGPKFNRKQRKAFWECKEDLIGKIASVTHFGLTEPETGVRRPRFPLVVGFRNLDDLSTDHPAHTLTKK